MDKAGVQGRRAEERDVRAVRLPQGGLGPHPGRQAGLLKPGAGGPADRSQEGAAAAVSRQASAATRTAEGTMTTSEIHTPISAEELAHTFEEQAPEVDLSVYAHRGLGDVRDLLADDARGLPPVLHPLRPQQLLRLDRGDRDLLPGGDRVHGVGDVRPARPAHPGRLPVPLPAGRRRAGARDRDRRDPHRCSSPTRPGSSGAS